MRRKLLVALISGVLVPSLASAARQSNAATAAVPSDDPSAPEAPAASDAERYSALVDRIRAGDRTVDFTRLRMAFTETPEYRGTMMAAYQALWRPLGQGDFAQAIAVAETVLAQNFVEPNAHMVASIAYQQTEQSERADFHRYMVAGLLQSIRSSGDGQTPETAFEVIDISEEYALMRAMNLQAKNVGSSFSPDGGPVLDIVTAVDPRTGMTTVIHFRVKSRPGGKPAAPPQ